MQDGRMWTYIRTFKQGLNLMPPMPSDREITIWKQ